VNDLVLLCLGSKAWWLEIILELDRNLKLNLQGIGSQDCFSAPSTLLRLATLPTTLQIVQSLAQRIKRSF